MEYRIDGSVDDSEEKLQTLAWSSSQKGERVVKLCLVIRLLERAYQ